MPRTLALVLCAALAGACEKDEPRAAAAAHEPDLHEAARRSREAMEQIVRLERSTNDLIAELEAAVAAAQDEAGRSAANARLDALRKQQAELQAQIATARAAAARAEQLEHGRTP